MDIHLWRIRIGMFNGISRSCSSPCQVTNSVTDSLPPLLDLFHRIISPFDMLSGIFIHGLLLTFIILDIYCSAFFHCFNVARISASCQAPSSCKKLLLALFLIFNLNSSSISIIIRLLLLKSGNVEPNPGPSSPKLLSFGVWNVDSLLARDGVKKSFIESIQSANNFDIFGICETYLTDKIQDNDLDIEGFAKIPKRADCRLANPQSRPRGGVCLYFKESLPIKRRSDLELLDETICAEISLNRKKIIYIVSYRSPSQTPSEFKHYMQKLQTTYIKASAENPSIIILTGDFNARSPLLWADERSQTPEGKDLADFCTFNCLEQLIKDPTHIPNDNTQTCIDLILTNQPYLFVDSGVIHSPDPLLKHQIIFGKLNFNVPCPPPYKRKIWDFTLAHTLAIKSQMSNVPWEHLFFNRPLDDIFKIFTDNFLSIISSNIPNKIVTFDDGDAPWVTTSLKNLLHKDRKIYAEWNKNGRVPDLYARVKLHQEKTKKAIMDAKSRFLDNLSKKICNPTTGQKTFWSAYKRLSNKKKNTNIPPVFENGKYISDFKEKSSIFNKYFAIQCQPFDIESTLPVFTPLTSNSLSDITFSHAQIIAIIKKLDSKKANGFDNISAAMLKTCPDEVARPLFLIFKKCLESGSFPSAWKHANVQPVHKKNSRQDKSNYRPISLLCICSKIYEKIVFDTMYKFFLDNNLLSPNQSGFRPGDSTINQLLAITTEIYNAFENRKETRAAFLDISKAFDKVWHSGLIFKLKQNGISGNLLNMLKNYLMDRKQRVILNGIESSWEPIFAGVPQGSVLGPLLFLIYINDLTQNISANIKLFADDSSLFIKVDNVETAHQTLMSDLDTITAWARRWKMKFNPEISKQAIEVVFSCKYDKTRLDHPPLFFNEIPVARKKSTKHLGIILDEKLNFREHILEAIEKAKKGLSLMKFLSSFVNRKTLVLTYTMHVRPHLEYGDILFHDCATYLMDMLESIQYQAGLIATGCWKNTSRDKLYKELGWESLSERRNLRRLLAYHKIISHNSPSYLNEYVLHDPPLVGSTDRYLRTFFPYCFSKWNALDPELKSLEFNPFKSKFLSLIRPTKCNTFGINDRYGLKLLTCLRVDHSDLRSHRFAKQFNCPDPICSCGIEEETPEHYFLRCPLFQGPRDVLLNKVSETLECSVSDFDDSSLCQLLLYGKPSFNNNINKNILCASIKFIKSSKRFKTFEAFIVPSASQS